MSSEIYDYLTTNGYRLFDLGNGWWRTAAHFRNGVKETSLNVEKTTGKFKDWVSGASGNFKDLVSLISGEKNISSQKLLELLTSIEEATPELPKIKVAKKYSPEVLKNLEDSYQLYLDRGIDAKILKGFKIGTATTGKLKNRIVTPIFNRSGDFIDGFFGRWHEEKVPSWSGAPRTKNLGNTDSWLYPVYINDRLIRHKKEIILLEGVSDMLALWEISVKHSLILWGARISQTVINYISSIKDLKKVIIATNNDFIDNDSGTGNKAATSIKKKLLGFLPEEKIEIRLPDSQNDWCQYLQKNKKQELIDFWKE